MELLLLANGLHYRSSRGRPALWLQPGGGLYGLIRSFFLGAAFLVFLVRKPAQRTSSKAVTWNTILAGFRFIFGEKVVLGAISLDLFAVLLGGAIALMPVFASDVLTLGPWGLGLLRSAPGVGAIIVAVMLASFPIRHNAGVFICSSALPCLVWQR